MCRGCGLEKTKRGEWRRGGGRGAPMVGADVSPGMPAHEMRRRKHRRSLPLAPTGAPALPPRAHCRASCVLRCCGVGNAPLHCRAHGGATVHLFSFLRFGTVFGFRFVSRGAFELFSGTRVARSGRHRLARKRCNRHRVRPVGLPRGRGGGGLSFSLSSKWRLPRAKGVRFAVPLTPLYFQLLCAALHDTRRAGLLFLFLFPGSCVAVSVPRRGQIKRRETIGHCDAGTRPPHSPLAVQRVVMFSGCLQRCVGAATLR